MDQKVSIVSRDKWGAVAPRKKQALKAPAKRVVIHHTAFPNCTGQTECAKRLCSIQSGHMRERGFDDIGYNFLVAGDGTVYEGRGWGVVGAHAKGSNHDSLGVAFMGNFNDDTPSTEAISSVKRLLQEGVSVGLLSPEFVLQGHKDLGQTECPGEKLYAALPRLRDCFSVSIVSRDEWGAVAPRKKQALKAPAKRVVIHHTALPNCTGQTECAKRLCSIQNMHMKERGFDDIGYNFLVAGDGTVYEGRGWGVVGAHAKGSNHDSLGVAFMGNFNDDTPSTEAISSVKGLLQEAVSAGHLSPQFVLQGHKDLGQTECPGEKLYAALPRLRGPAGFTACQLFLLQQREPSYWMKPKGSNCLFRN